MRIYFRVDSSKEIGTGHLMRCLSLAEELKKNGAEIIFICRKQGDNSSEILKAKNFKVKYLAEIADESPDRKLAHSNWLKTSQVQDAIDTLKVMKKADWMIVDHYALDEDWQEVVGEKADKIMVIDDLADRNHKADILLDQNYFEDFASRYDELVGSSCQKLLGPAFAILRDEFAEQRKNLAERSGSIESIFISFGGVDADNYTQKVLNELGSFGGKIVIVAGASNPNFESLQKYKEAKKNIILHKSVNNMAELMANSDLAIGAGGSTTWERCALGLPSIVIPIAENQIEGSRALHDKQVISYCEINDLEELLELHLSNKAINKEMSDNGLKLVDAKGAKRVAANLLIKLRKAEPTDAKKILKIRNEEFVRENSINSEVIEWEAHKNWFERSLKNEYRHMLIAEIDKYIVGAIRYDINPELPQAAEISIFMSEKFSGKNFGEVILKKGENWLLNESSDIKTLTATVLEKNERSRKLFYQNGFDSDGDLFVKILEKK